MIFLSSLTVILILVIMYVILRRIISRKGVNSFVVFGAIYTLFYIIAPWIFIIFTDKRDVSTLYTLLLNQTSDDLILLNIIGLFLLFLIIYFSYNFTLNKNILVLNKDTFEKLNHKYYEIIKFFTNLVFIITFISIALIINRLGGIGNYLAFGAFTRGLNTAPENIIGSSYLQLITLSTVILATPFLYYYVYKIKSSRLYLTLLIFSTLMSTLFLIHNQGRAPLILFFVPFIFLIFKRKNSSGITLISFLFLISLLVIEKLNDFFRALTYGNANVIKSDSYITIFTREFMYPFTNFTLREKLVDIIEYRNYFDFLIWPFTMIPDRLLNFLGITKKGLESVSIKSTDAYSQLVGLNPSGGIPVDLMTLNFFQSGYTSLIFNSILFGILLKVIDNAISFFQNNLAIELIKYRISFSMVNMINNADPSAIVRNRLDIVLIIIVFMIIYILFKKKGSLIVEK